MILFDYPLSLIDLLCCCGFYRWPLFTVALPECH